MLCVVLGASLSQLDLQLPTKDNGNILPSLGIHGQLLTDNPLNITHVGENEVPLTLQSYVINIDSDKLSDGLSSTGRILLADGGIVEFNEIVTDLFDDQNQLVLATAKISGTLTGRNLPGPQIRSFVPMEDAWVDELLDGPVNCSITSAPETIERQRFTLNAQGPFGSIDSELQRQEGNILISSAQANLNATPELFRMLQEAQKKPWLPANPATVQITLREPYLLKFPADEEATVDLSAPFKTKFTIDDLIFTQSSTFEEPVGLRSMSADIDMVM